jgi:hypothetical protein
MPPLTAISPSVGTYALIFYSHWGNALHWGLVLTHRLALGSAQPQIRLALGSGTDVKSLATFSSGPDPSARPRRK